MNFEILSEGEKIEMTTPYRPKIKTATLPEEGSWIQIESEWALALSVPELEEIMGLSTQGYRYVWMYDRVEKAYLFCFQLSDHIDRAIVFPHDHAGRFLEDERAKEEIGMILTASEIGQGPYLFFKGIRFKKHS